MFEHTVVVIGRRRPGLMLMLLSILELTGCSSAPNPAERETVQIIEGLNSVHPQPICANGDNGRGLDNDVPWYDYYVEIDLAVDPLPAIESSAQGRGFQLGEDTLFINDLKGIPRSEGYIIVPYGNEKFNPTSSYLIATRKDATLRVTLTRSGAVSLYCLSTDARTYGAQMVTPQGKAILLLRMSMARV